MQQDIDSDLEEVPELLDNELPEAGPSMQLDRLKVPITLLTGYLGAGKSTLLEYIFTANHGYRIAVCMNDFGDTTDVEGESSVLSKSAAHDTRSAKSLTLNDPVTGEQTSSFLSLPNGCLCCSVKDMGIAAIEEMVASQQGVDWVLVELTGIADPAKSFWANEEMGDLVLDSIVCVVDSRNILSQLFEVRDNDAPNEALRQVACADVILLNKTDLVDVDTMTKVETTVRGINPTLRVHRTERSRVPLEDLFNLRAYSADSTGLLSFRANQNHDRNDGTLADHSHDVDDDHAPQPNRHSGISTTLIPLPPLSQSQFARLTAFLESVLWEGKLPPSASCPTLPAPEVLRTKGFIVLQDGRQCVLQGVTDLFEMRELHGSADVRGAGTAAEGGKVVFIGRAVDGGLGKALLAYVLDDA